MTKPNKIIIGTVTVLLCTGLVLWLRQELSRARPRPESLAGNLQPVRAATVPATSASTPQTSVPGPSAVAATQPKFDDMDVLDRNAILAEIEKRDLPAIFQAMLDAGRVEQDDRKQNSIQMVLAYALRGKPPSPEFLAHLRSFLEDRSNSSYERTVLVPGVLQVASTKETVNLLVDVATTSADKEMRRLATGSLAGVNAAWGDGIYHEEIAPALERAWRESSDQGLLFSVALAMMKAGAASSIELLLSTALDHGGHDALHRRLATDILNSKTILNPNAIPPLASRLEGQPPTSAASRLASRTLAQMNGVQPATRALIAWLQAADASAAPLARDYVLHTQDPDTWQTALDRAVPFRREENREAIRAGLAAYHSGRTSAP
jgi:hypothetical protein